LLIKPAPYGGHNKGENMKLNRKWKNKHGEGIILSSYFLQYKKEGGFMDAETWNTRQKELKEDKEKGVI